MIPHLGDGIMDKAKYIVKDQNGNTVAGFNAAHQVVQTTTHPDYIKTWTTEKAAAKWAANHAGCGYGLTTYTVTTL